MNFSKTGAAMLLLAGALALNAAAQTRSTTVAVMVANDQISVNVRQVKVPEGGSATWNLQTGGYVFSGNGIDVQAGGDYSCTIAGGGRSVTCVRGTGSGKGSYAYTLDIVPAAGGGSNMQPQLGQPPSIFIVSD